MPARATRVSAFLPRSRSQLARTEGKPLVLAVIDGLTPDVLESALDAGALPTLQFLAERGDYKRGVTRSPR